MRKVGIVVALLVTVLLLLGACAPAPEPKPFPPPEGYSSWEEYREEYEKSVQQQPAPATTTPPETVVTPSPPTTPSETTEPAPATTLITKEASEMVLTIADFEPGWVQHDAESTTKEGAQSAYHVYFYDGSMLPYPAVVQNTTAVYPSIELAQQVYLEAVPENVSLENPQIGDESFLDISIPVQKLLVFRKTNVVVWLWLQQDMFGDVRPYARIIEKRINQ